ncbi:MAG TPA: LysE family transporter [Anaerolineales bacterium]
MPELSFILRGWLLGFAIAAPVGPIGVLCIRRTLADGRTIGFLSGLGAATADMFYGAVAAFGLTAIQGVLIKQQLWLQIVGGFFLVYLGFRTLLAVPAQRAAAPDSKPGKLAAYVTTLGLTLTNPATILSFALIFAGFRIGADSGDYVSAATLVLGVFLGSASWWLLLSGIVGLFRERFTPAWMVWVNRVAGTLIIAFGVAALLYRRG